MIKSILFGKWNYIQKIKSEVIPPQALGVIRYDENQVYLWYYSPSRGSPIVNVHSSCRVLNWELTTKSALILYLLSHVFTDFIFSSPWEYQTLPEVLNLPKRIFSVCPVLWRSQSRNLAFYVSYQGKCRAGAHEKLKREMGTLKQQHGGKKVLKGEVSKYDLDTPW